MKNEIEDIISIIVPVYNVEGYIDKTISSICNQTYSNMEIILVDDGSTDLSGQKCDIYAREDYRIRVIHKKNGGLVSARKSGVQAANGKYIMMVDGDDWVENDIVEKLYSLLIENDVEIVTSGLIRDYREGSERYVDELEEGVYKREKINNNKHRIIFNGSENRYGIRPAVVGKLFITKSIQELYRDMDEHIENGEDWAILYPMLFNANSLYVSHQCYYHYVIRDSSITYSINRDYLFSMQKWYEFVTGHIAEMDLDIIKKQVDAAYLKLILRGVNYHMGLHQEVTIPSYVLPNNLPTGRYVLYGAGKVGTAYHAQLINDEKRELVAWVDQKWSDYPDESKHVAFIKKCEFDYILIAITYEGIAESIREKIMQSYGVDKDKIIWSEPKGIMDTYVRWENAE